MKDEKPFVKSPEPATYPTPTTTTTPAATTTTTTAAAAGEETNPGETYTYESGGEDDWDYVDESDGAEVDDANGARLPASATLSQFDGLKKRRRPWSIKKEFVRK